MTASIISRIAAVTHTHTHEAAHILTLTDANFTDTLNSHPIMFVDFYAPWCGVCKKFSPRWKEIAKTYASRNSVIKFASIDADSNRNVAVQYEINSYPTLVLFYYGDRYLYEEAHEESQLEEFIERITESPAPVTDIPVQQVWISDKLALYVTDHIDRDILDAFEQASRVVRFLKFYIAKPSKELSATLKDKDGSIFLTKRRGAEVLPYKGEITGKTLIEFFGAYK